MTQETVENELEAETETGTPLGNRIIGAGIGLLGLCWGVVSLVVFYGAGIELFQGNPQVALKIGLFGLVILLGAAYTVKKGLET